MNKEKEEAVILGQDHGKTAKKMRIQYEMAGGDKMNI